MEARTEDTVGSSVYVAGEDGRKRAAGLPTCVGTVVSEAALSSPSRIPVFTMTSLGVVGKDDEYGSLN